MFDYLDSQGVQAVLEAVKGKIPSSLPANGGNADTVDNKHAADLMNVNYAASYDCDALYDTGYYPLWNATNAPRAWGSLFVMPYRKNYGNTKPDYAAQIFIPNGDTGNTRKMYFRTSTGDTYNDWNELFSSNNLPYIVGSASSVANSNTITTNHGFTPTAVFWWMISEGRVLRSAQSFDTVSFDMSSAPSESKLVNYIIFK